MEIAYNIMCTSSACLTLSCVAIQPTVVLLQGKHLHGETEREVVEVVRAGVRELENTLASGEKETMTLFLPYLLLASALGRAEDCDGVYVYNG